MGNELTLNSISAEPFVHYQHAHCESGVTTNLLRHYHVEMSEPMAFGIGAGIFFGHLPFVKINGTPGTTFRTWPGAIFKGVTKRLGIEIHSERFRTPDKAMQALDAVLDAGMPAGMLSSVFYLPYLPEAFRFHFNAHNLVVYGREGNDYLVSDPIMENVTTISRQALAKARFAKGAPEPRGYMYYIRHVPASIDVKKAVQEGIKKTGFLMMSLPVPWFGNKAVFLLAEKIKAYPKKLKPRQAALYLGNVIRMQEEIGTGGGGFRYLYAAFLQESAQLLGRDDLAGMSQELTAIGDKWRAFAYSAARIMKDRQSEIVSFDELSNMLRQCAVAEQSFFTRLRHLKW